eukprot:scaffold108162_cov28-Tisochrysis_lutea.AAC.3
MHVLTSGTNVTEFNYHFPMGTLSHCPRVKGCHSKSHCRSNAPAAAQAYCASVPPCGAPRQDDVQLRIPVAAARLPHQHRLPWHVARNVCQR